jgi:hypothetical protein
VTVSQNGAQSKDLDGTTLQTVTASNQYDAFGTPAFAEASRD